MRFIYVFLIACCLCQNKVVAQIKFTEKTIEKSYYAHIDKDLYLPDENIWFKIYIYSPNFFDTSSQNIYVDLLDEQNKILDHQVYLSYLSSVNGQIKIPKDYPYSKANLLIYQLNEKKEKIGFYQKDVAVLNKALKKRVSAFTKPVIIQDSSQLIIKNKYEIQKKDEEIIVLIDNQDKTLGDIIFTIKNQDDTLYSSIFSMQNRNQLTIRFPKNRFSTGYYLFQLNEKENIIFKQWIYNLSAEHLLSPKIILDSFSTAKEGKNVWKISQLPIANFSISIVDADLPNSDKNIASELLFNSVNNKLNSNMGPYFINNTTSNEYFIDKTIKTQQLYPLFYKNNKNTVQDNFLSIKGRLIKTSNKKIPLPKQINLIMGGPNKKTEIIQAPINLDSSFIVNKLIFYDSLYAKALLGNNDQDGFKIMIEKDTALNDPDFVFENRMNDSLISFINKTKATDLLKNSIQFDSLLKKLTLQQVIVNSRFDYKLKKLDELYSSGLFTGSNAYRLDVDNDPFFQNNYFDISSYITSRIPGISYNSYYNPMSENDISPFSWRGSTTGLYLDEIRTSWDMIRSMQRPNIGYIKVFRPIFFGDSFNGSGGAIIVYTKKFNDTPSQIDTKGSTFLQGYFSSTYFNEQINKMEEKLKQLNTTLYWNPYLSFYTDSSKEQTIRFLNNQFTKRFLLKIEGIDERGQVLYFEKVIE